MSENQNKYSEINGSDARAAELGPWTKKADAETSRETKGGETRRENELNLKIPAGNVI